MLSPLFSNFVQSTPCSFCCLVSLADCLITPQLMCCFAQWYYGPTPVAPCYLSTSITLLLCVLCDKTYNLLKVWHGWNWFCYYSDLISVVCINGGSSPLFFRFFFSLFNTLIFLLKIEYLQFPTLLILLIHSFHNNNINFSKHSRKKSAL